MIYINYLVFVVILNQFNYFMIQLVIHQYFNIIIQGVAIIECSNQETALKAIEEYDSRELDGIAMSVIQLPLSSQ